MKTRQSTRREQHHSSQPLPPEIWQIIARQLGPREWAKVAGICKTTWHLQLNPVRIRQHDYPCIPRRELCSKGAAWVLKRASFAQQLELDLPRDPVGLCATIEELMCVPGGFSGLTSMSMRAWPHDLDRDLRVLTAVLAWIVGQARGLLFLRVDLVGLPYLPTLPSIRHLQLETGGGAFSRLARALARLVTLETLCLDFRGISLPEDVEPHLDLRALTRLESVMLDGAIPASLALAQGTTLHVTVYSLADARRRIWPDAGGALRSFTVEANDDKIESEDDIPSWLLEPCSLETLVLALRCFGKTDRCNTLNGTITLRGAFVNTKRLCLDCSNIHICVPEQYEWTNVNIHSCGKLLCAFNNVYRFASSTVEFDFIWEHLEGMDLITLALCLEQSGREYTLDPVGSLECNLCSPNCLELHDLSYSNCKCGACHYCCRLDNFQGPGPRQGIGELEELDHGVG